MTTDHELHGFRFTVLTPTYKRAHLLQGAYQALCAQTYRNFEWVIVDDGGADGTADLVASWNPFFPIRYFWKPNGGTQSALNVGIQRARGEFILQFDDDDTCVPTALERFDFRWRQIPDPSRFASLSCLCKTPTGDIVGDPFPAEIVDAWTYADQLRYRQHERWGINRADILKQFPFPEDERWISPSLVWNRISRKYAGRFFNEALRIYEPGTNGVSRNMFALRAASPRNTRLFYQEVLFSPAPFWLRIRAGMNLCRFAFTPLLQKCGIPLYNQRKKWKGSRD